MKLQNMIDDGIRQGIHSPTVGTTSKKFHDFFCQNFKGKYDRQEDMKLKSNQPSKIHAIAKTHKFHNSKSQDLPKNFSNRDLQL